VRASRIACRSVTRGRRLGWDSLPDEELLEVRLCDLKLGIRGTELETAIERLYRELAMREIRFRPHCWLAQEWFSPDGIPGIAIPFYLAHPRLMRLERRFMREVEGGNRNWLMRILRHEAPRPLARGVRSGVAAVPRRVSAAAGQPPLRAALGRLVRASASHRRLCRNLRSVAQAAFSLAAGV
jgi:hypothetical protein